VVCPAPAAETVGAVPQVPTAAATPDPAAQQAAAAQVIQQQVKMFAFWDRLTTDTPETYWLWIGLGGGLGCLVPLGFLLCITLIGACLGIPMLAIGSGAGGFAGVLLIYRYVRKKSDANVPPPSPPAQPTAPKT
jgi:hypothetical protein